MPTIPKSLSGRAPRSSGNAAPGVYEPPTTRMSAVILAGGQSSRMGRDKAWVEVRGKPMIHHTYQIIASLGITEIFVSGAAGREYPGIECRVLIDLEPGAGPLGGIERALRESTSPLVLVLPVDLPRMSVECLRKLTDRCQGLVGAVARLEDDLEPLVAVYPKRCHTYAVWNLARSQLSVRDFALACLKEGAIKPVKLSGKQADCFRNCNRPEDLA